MVLTVQEMKGSQTCQVRLGEASWKMWCFSVREPVRGLVAFPRVAKEVKLGEVDGSQAVKSLITQLQNLDFYQAQGTTGG